VSIFSFLGGGTLYISNRQLLCGPRTSSIRTVCPRPPSSYPVGAGRDIVSRRDVSAADGAGLVGQRAGRAAGEVRRSQVAASGATDAQPRRRPASVRRSHRLRGTRRVAEPDRRRPRHHLRHEVARHARPGAQRHQADSRRRLQGTRRPDPMVLSRRDNVEPHAFVLGLMETLTLGHMSLHMWSHLCPSVSGSIEKDGHILGRMWLHVVAVRKHYNGQFRPPDATPPLS